MPKHSVSWSVISKALAAIPCALLPFFISSQSIAKVLLRSRPSKVCSNCQACARSRASSSETSMMPASFSCQIHGDVTIVPLTRVKVRRHPAAKPVPVQPRQAVQVVATPEMFKAEPIQLVPPVAVMQASRLLNQRIYC